MLAHKTPYSPKPTYNSSCSFLVDSLWSGGRRGCCFGVVVAVVVLRDTSGLKRERVVVFLCPSSLSLSLLSLSLSLSLFPLVVTSYRYCLYCNSVLVLFC